MDVNKSAQTYTNTNAHAAAPMPIQYMVPSLFNPGDIAVCLDPDTKAIECLVMVKSSARSHGNSQLYQVCKFPSHDSDYVWIKDQNNLMLISSLAQFNSTSTCGGLTHEEREGLARYISWDPRVRAQVGHKRNRDQTY